MPRHLPPLLLAAALLLPGAGTAHVAGSGSAPRVDLRDAPPAENHRYVQLAIVSPHDEDTVFDNGGSVAVTILMAPPGPLDGGDRVELYVDGRRADEATATATGFQLAGIERGAHWLQARIANADGRTVLASAPVQFFLWQASRHFPNRR